MKVLWSTYVVHTKDPRPDVSATPVYLASDVEAKLSAIRTLALAIRPTQWSHETEQIIRLIDEVLA